MDGTKCRIEISNEEVYKINEFEPVRPNDFVLIQLNQMIHHANVSDNMSPGHPNRTTIIIHAYGTKVDITTHLYPECEAQPGLNITNERATRLFSLKPGNRVRYCVSIWSYDCSLFPHYTTSITA